MKTLVAGTTSVFQFYEPKCQSESAKSRGTDLKSCGVLSVFSAWLNWLNPK